MSETYKVVKKETNKYIVKVLEPITYKVVLKEVVKIETVEDGGEF